MQVDDYIWTMILAFKADDVKKSWSLGNCNLQTRNFECRTPVEAMLESGPK